MHVSCCIQSNAAALWSDNLYHKSLQATRVICNPMNFLEEVAGSGHGKVSCCYTPGTAPVSLLSGVDVATTISRPMKREPLRAQAAGTAPKSAHEGNTQEHTWADVLILIGIFK